MPDESRVEVPLYVTRPFEVYVNGVRQEPGRDFRDEGAVLVFTRELAQEGRLSAWRWLSMLLGIAGTYRQHESIDLVYDVGGRRTVATLRPS